MSGPHQALARKQTDSGPGFPASQPKVSLIVATCNRVDELERLLASLDQQSYKNVEVIVVDQNPDDRLVPVLQRHRGLAIRRLSSEVGVSKARNVGLRAAQGDLIAFPDDDCWYPDQLLADVVQWFEAYPECDGLLTGVRTANNKIIAPKFPPPPGPCNRTSVMRCAVAFNAFLRRRVIAGVGLYREDLGLGSASRYQSGEDLDYIIRCVDRGFSLSYQPGLTVRHPEMKSRGRLRQKNYPYALGVGYVWRIHGYPWWWCLGEIGLRSMGGAVVHLCQADFEGSSFYVSRAAGQFLGYISGSKETPGSQPVQPSVDDHA